MGANFNLILTGRCLPGQSRETAAAELAKVMRLEQKSALALLSGHETVVKRAVEQTRLAAYVQALQRTGAELRVEEVIKPVAAPVQPAVPAQETVKCPACGTEQPKRTLCRQCGTDIPRMLAAKAEPKNVLPARIAPVPSAAMPASRAERSTTMWSWYKRTRLIEVLMFLFMNPLWALLASVDRERSMLVRSIAMLLLVGGTGLSYWRLFVGNAQVAAVNQAAKYAYDVSERVGEYAIANKRFPVQDSIELPHRPPSVGAVEIGPQGQVRVTLGGEDAAGAAITLVPVVKDRTLHWECSWEKLPWLVTYDC